MTVGMDILTGEVRQTGMRGGAMCVSIERQPDSTVTNLPMERYMEFSPGAVAAGTSWTSATLDLGDYPRPPKTLYLFKLSTTLTLLNEELELECSNDGTTWWPAVLPGTGLATLVKAVAGAKSFGTAGVPIGRYARVRLKAGLTATGADTKVRVAY